MPYNPAGLFSLVASYFASPGASIRTEQHNPVFEDVASALSSVLLRDGRAPMTGALNMNGFPVNGVAAGNSPDSVATLAQAMPIGAVIDFAGSTAPAGWALCYGQAISRVTFATLFALLSTTYGAGDGSTTFNLPDMRGRGSIGKDDMGGNPAGRVTNATSGVPGATLGGVGGVQVVALTLPQIPGHIHPNVLNDGGHSHSGAPDVGARIMDRNNDNQTNRCYVPETPSSVATGPNVAPNTTGITISNASVGGDQAHTNMHPVLVFNKIIRISYDG